MERRDLNDMAVFAAIAQAGNITAAAEKMDLPKSNISRRLARLEERLGTQLLERNTRTSKLTSIGARYADYCRLMVEEANAADLVIDKSLAVPTGQLRVSTSVLVGQQIVAPAIALYAREFPLVRVILDLNNTRSNLIEDGFDVAFRIGVNADSSLIIQSLASFSICLYASPEYLSTVPNLEDPTGLTNCRCLVMSDTEEPTRWMLENGKVRKVISISGEAIANDFVALKTLAVAGSGIAMLPSYAVHTEEKSGRLSRVLPGWSGQKAELSAVYPSRRGATPKQRALIDHVKTWIAQNIEK
jgi:DNA-binding transcriptional LysR family regulator